MIKQVINLSFLLAIVCITKVSARSINPNPLLLLISFDGFRWDYLHMHNLSNFNYLKLHGSHAEHIRNSFATVTFPNHWTIATGMYEETHGILENEMYDPTLNETFNYVSPSSQTAQWFGQNSLVEPIWTTNQKNGNGRLSAAEWVGAGIVFSNQTINYIPYNHSKSFYDLVDLFTGLFSDQRRPINFGALYFDEPDHTGHMYGPYSSEMKIKLEELNDVLGYLIKSLEENDLLDRLNVIVTSDHGMDTISANKTIFLDSFIDLSLFQAYGSRACYSLFLKDKKNFEFVYGTLKKIQVVDTYKKEELPESLHYRNNVRIGDIVIITKIGYAVYLSNQTINWTINNGNHGYYNNETTMHPIFIAHGPAFKKNFTVPTFNNVDIYPLMCHILEIQAAVNNGSLDIVRLMLVETDFCESITMLALLAFSLILVAAWYVSLLKKKLRRNSGNSKEYLIDDNNDDSVNVSVNQFK